MASSIKPLVLPFVEKAILYMLAALDSISSLLFARIKTASSLCNYKETRQRAAAEMIHV